jgi:hypothetical protein
VIKAEREVESGLQPSEVLRVPGGGDRQLIDKHCGARWLRTPCPTPSPTTRCKGYGPIRANANGGCSARCGVRLASEIHGPV